MLCVSVRDQVVEKVSCMFCGGSDVHRLPFFAVLGCP
jgi:hypothetical protein